MTSGQTPPTRVLVVRCPDWPPPDPGRDRPAHKSAETRLEPRAFEQVIDAVAEFCPRIEVVRPGICAFGARGPARYFGGEPELARKITESIKRLGFDCGGGSADGMFAALQASMDALAGPDRHGPTVMTPPGPASALLAPPPSTVPVDPEPPELALRSRHA